MSKRIVHDVQRITYSFSRDEIEKLIFDHAVDNRGFQMLPGASKVEWTADGLTFVYEYANEKKDATADPLPPLKLKTVSSPSACDHESHESGDPRCQHAASCSCRAWRQTA